MKGLLPFNKGLFDIDFRDDFDDLFDKRPISMRHHFTKDSFKLDVQEKDTEYLIEADLPGVKKEELKINLDDEKLTISIEREEKVDEERDNYIHKERKYSSMSRSIYLVDAKKDGIHAKLDNGVLKILIPKETSTPTASVEINIE